MREEISSQAAALRGFRGFLIVFALCAVVGAGVLTALWQHFAPAARDFLASVETEAAHFAQERDQSACVPEAFARLARCDGLGCQIKTPIFTRLCLDRAAPDPTICDEVPDSLIAAATWPMTACLDIDANPDICQRILREQLRVCLDSDAAA